MGARTQEAQDMRDSEPVAMYQGKDDEYGYDTISLYKDIPIGTDLYLHPAPQTVNEEPVIDAVFPLDIDGEQYIGTDPVAWADPKDLEQDGYSHSFYVHQVAPGNKNYVPLFTHPAPQPVNEELLDLMAVMFDAIENGDPCYENPDEGEGFMGNDATFDRVADILNEHRPVTAILKAEQMKGEGHGN